MVFMANANTLFASKLLFTCFLLKDLNYETENNYYCVFFVNIHV